MNRDHIIHEPENKRFIIPLEGSAPAELKYVINADPSRASGRSVVNFTNTYVPVESRNKGLAEKLVRSGISWAREQDYRMEASCSYVAKFLRKSRRQEPEKRFLSHNEAKAGSPADYAACGEEDPGVALECLMENDAKPS